MASGSGNLNETANLPFGATVTYRATCTIPASATVGGLLNDTATVAAGTGVTETASADNSAIDTFTVALSPDLTATITDGATTVNPGDNVTYTATVKNNGPTIAPQHRRRRYLRRGDRCTWICSGASGGTCSTSGSGNINDTVNLVVGASVTYVAQCKVSAAANGTLSNLITADTARHDVAAFLQPTANVAIDADVVSVSSDVAVTITDNRDSVQVGDVVDYVIDVTNPAGPSSPAMARSHRRVAGGATGSWTPYR